jgi:hypothetical protein
VSRDWFIVIVSCALIFGTLATGMAVINRQIERAVCLLVGTIACAYIVWSF